MLLILKVLLQCLKLQTEEKLNYYFSVLLTESKGNTEKEREKIDYDILIEEHYKHIFVKDLSDIDLEECISNLKKAKNIFAGKLSKEDHLDVMKALISINNKARIVFIDKIQEFKFDGVNIQSRINLMHAFSEVESDQMSIFDYTKQLTVSSMNEENKTFLLVTIAEIQANQRERICFEAQKICDDNVVDRTSILKTLTKIKEDQLADFITYSSQLFTGSITGEDKAALIADLAEIQMNQLNETIKYTQQFFIANMNIGIKGSLLKIVANTPIEKRKDIFIYIPQIIENYFITKFNKDSYCWLEKIFKNLEKTNKDQRADIIYFSQELINNISKNILDTGCYIDEGERIFLQSIIIECLTCMPINHVPQFCKCVAPVISCVGVFNDSLSALIWGFVKKSP